MKTIKIIELLNKIANGETPPRKIRYLDIIYIYNNTVNDYAHAFTEYDSDYLLESVDVNEKCLNKEIEIIEDDKENKKIEKIGKGHYIDDEEVLEKIDEIIDYINNNHIPRID